jgi:chain length determinant protein (polysaccharide antigen chain regulator)
MAIIEQKNKKDYSSQHDVLVSPLSQSDEISLLDVWQILNGQRKLIFFIVIFFTLLAVSIAMLLPRLYRSEIVVLPPFAKDVEQLTVPDFYVITVENLYGKFIQNLQSITLQKQFFETNNLYAALRSKNSQGKDEYEVFYKQFHNLLNVKKVSAANNKNDTFTVTLDGRDRKQIIEWLNNFVLLVDGYTVQQVVDSVIAKATVQVTAVEEKIDNLRQVARQRRLDQIAALEEAAAVARKIQLKKPVGVVYSYRQEIKDTKGEVLNIKETPSYFRGTNALEAEVEALKKRKNDDPFISSLRDLQEEISFYQGISLTGRGLHAARIDQQAVALKKPVKPNRKLIVVLGVMIGAVVAFLVAFIKNGSFVSLKN